MRSVPTVVLLFVALGVASFGPIPADARRHPAPTPTPAAPAPTPVPTPTPLSEELRLARLPSQLQALADDAPGILGIALYDPYRDARIAIRGDRMFPLASVFKLAVAVTAYRLADQHKLDLNARVSVDAADIRHGASPIADAHPRGNVDYTMWELVRAMIVDSDNTACDIVLREIGGPDAVQAMMTRLGYTGFAIRKTEADMYADDRAGRTFAHGGAENGGTPNAVADLLTAIATQRAAGLDATNELLLDLAGVRTGADRFRAGFPSTIRLAHKTGSGDTTGGLTEATNDAGIVTFPDGRRIVLVALLTASPADDATRAAVLAKVARTVYAAYAP
jgi:beta-lactamase class A